MSDVVGEGAIALPDVVVNEVPPSYDESQTTEAEGLITEMKLKADADRKEMKERLDCAKQVKEEAGESLYNKLFGMLVQDCVDSILKKEVVRLTTEMCLFRKNISEKMTADESTIGKPMNIGGLPAGFNEAWRLWRAGDTEDGRATRGETSCQALVTAISTE